MKDWSAMRELYGERFAEKVEEGARCCILGQPCRDMDREELLAAIACAGESITAEQEARRSTERMEKFFREHRR